MPFHGGGSGVVAPALTAEADNGGDAAEATVPVAPADPVIGGAAAETHHHADAGATVSAPADDVTHDGAAAETHHHADAGATVSALADDSEVPVSPVLQPSAE